LEACLASETGQDQAADSDALISEEEALAGFSARRARRLLFLIESRTAHLAARSSEAEDLLGGEQAGRERDLAYFDAFVLGRDPPKRPTIQDIERYAPEWRELVPDNVTVRAATARFLGEKYRFTQRQAQNIRSALALDEAVPSRRGPITSLGDRARFLITVSPSRPSSSPPSGCWLRMPVRSPA